MPKTQHARFGHAAPNRSIPWDLAADVRVLGAIKRIRPDRVRFYTRWEPASPWWRLSRPLVGLIGNRPPTKTFGVPLRHFAHRADVLRLQVLLDQGGICPDTESLLHCLRDDLLDHEAVTEPSRGAHRAGRLPASLGRHTRRTGSTRGSGPGSA
ncbi:MAG: hypothetical protein NZM07_01710 [Elioraea sp.]|nr:hypothetical protein [Elioraea sp.]